MQVIFHLLAKNIKEFVDNLKKYQKKYFFLAKSTIKDFHITF